jgi:protein gp37
MQKSKIEWTDYTINPVKGLCPVGCSYCYARKMYKRFHWSTQITFNPVVFNEIRKVKKPSKYFVGSTMELFGDWIKPNWMQIILGTCDAFQNDTFIFLTKQPQNLTKYKFPDNCWIGVSTNGNDCRSGLEDIFREVHAKVKFVSIEPLLDYTPMDFRWIDWVIVGQQTPISKKTEPRIQWIEDIVKRAKIEKKPVFLKNNLYKSIIFNGNDGAELPNWAENDYSFGNLRQEFPNG